MTGARRVEVAKAQLEDGWVTQRYNEIADSWARKIRRLGFTRAYRAVFRRIVRRGTVAVEPGRAVRIADIGVGAGDASLSLARALRQFGSSSQTVHVCGVDTSTEMLRVASDRFAADEIAFTSACCDMCATGLEPSSCDVVVAAHSVEHLDDPGAALAEIDRVLAPGGTAILIMTRCTIPTIALEAQWPIHCVRSDLLRKELSERGYPHVDVVRFPAAVIPNLLSFVCVATKSDS